MRYLAMWGLLAALFLWPASGRAEEGLTLAFGNDTRRFTGAELLARPDVATVQTPHDESYGRGMTYRAVPLLALLPPDALNGIETVEARATDGFVAQIPAGLVAKGAAGGAAHRLSGAHRRAARRSGRLSGPKPARDCRGHRGGPTRE